MVSFPDEREINNKKRIPLSISNPPTDANKVILTVRNMGGFTAEIHKLGQGDELMITAPVGTTFAFDQEANKDDNLVFLSGGTGITPFMSIIRFMLAKGMKNKAVLFDANRTPEEIIFKKELDTIDDEQEQITVHHVLSDMCPPSDAADEGFICQEVIDKYIGDEEKKNYRWLICGPPPMVDEMKKLVKELDIPEEHITIEEWQLPGQGKEKPHEASDEMMEERPQERREEPASDDQSQNNQESGGGDAILASDSEEVKLAPGPIMEAAEKLGVPFSCRQGICGTCEVDVVEGMENLEPKNEKENNMKLPDDARLCCQAKIKNGKVKIDF
ncbi:MAG: 2Fe-2S iron-sulfur cluster-binding protein [Nanoarchaeota archaeon]